MGKQIEITLSPRQASDSREIAYKIAKSLSISTSDILSTRILRRSIDARRVGDIRVNMLVEVFTEEDNADAEGKITFRWKNVSDSPEVIVVGAGPAGLCAALKLIERGIRPIILERGKSVSERKFDIAAINRNEDVNPDSNYSFGEGGAGTYSDGKLYTRSRKRGSNREALEILHFHGASEEILYEAHPHIGTDLLPRIIANMRNTIIEYGGEVLFSSKVEDIIVRNNKVVGVKTENGNHIPALAVILATGHSARDIYRLLDRKGIEVQQKNFAMGVRVEHPQELINRIQYKGYMDEWLPSASYQLVEQVAGRGVYSFCMCPGGFIVPAMTESGQCVVNGMSPSGRNNIYANSGIVTEVRAEDIPEYISHYGQLGGMVFQEQLEKLIYSHVADHQKAPSQILTDFVKGKSSSSALGTSYHPGLVPGGLVDWFPQFMSDALREGFKKFDRKMHGFLTSSAQVIGLESRTSSPVRIPRDKDTLQHISIEGLFPVGEGSGYAGGIVSAAIDGMRAAEMINVG